MMVSVKTEDHIDVIFAGGMMMHVSHKTLIFDISLFKWGWNLLSRLK